MRAPVRRRQLLEMALPRFARNGFRGTTTAELATAAGVTPPILYRHFASKLDLFVALVDDAGEQLRRAWAQRALADGPGTEALPAARILLAGLVEAPESAPIRQACDRQLAALRGDLATRLGPGQDLDRRARLILSAWLGHVAAGGAHGDLVAAIEATVGLSAP